ncbi:MAG: hypothetical protein DMF61_20100 [Blastocatellia bacterium AA13]|nr:MAG: hypothetical protein DMF61_20100 [Blastocatellia bacterium AA13]
MSEALVLGFSKWLLLFAPHRFHIESLHRPQKRYRVKHRVRIVSEVRGFNGAVYDIDSNLPSTIRVGVISMT